MHTDVAPPPPAVAPPDLSQLLLRLGGLTAAHIGTVAATYDLPVPVVMALDRIDPDHPEPMHQLAAALACDPSYVTWIADQLEAHGFGVREPAVLDRRVKVLRLTPAGVTMRDTLRAAFAQPPLALASLSAAERDLLTTLLQRVLSGPGAASPDLCAVFSVRRHHAERG